MRPNPLTAVEHIDLMIQSYKIEKTTRISKEGADAERKNRMTLADQDVNSLRQNIRVTRENIKSETVKFFQT